MSNTEVIMEITKIVVSYQETANLGNYSNVKPSATVEVALSDDDDPAVVQAQALDRARGIVQSAVDDALEANDQEPKYTTEPRYQLLVRHGKREAGVPSVVVIDTVGTTYPHFSRFYIGFRLPAIRRLARQNYRDALIIDTTVEPDALPPLLEQIAAEEADIAAQREREREQYRQEQERRRQEYAAQHADDDEDEDGDDL